MTIPQHVDKRPPICGYEDAVAEAMAQTGPIYPPDSGIDFAHVRSAFAVALHMHQPMIPAGGDELRTAEAISNLQYMAEHLAVGDNHNSPVFRWCYKRLGEFVPALVKEGKRPRVMLDYSGCLLWGLQKMEANDVLDSLRAITCDPKYHSHVEWLGTAWGHPVAPSTPVQDYRLHVRAWQQHFAGLFGLEALRRVRGFSPCEMALPNHPDVAYEFVKTLNDCGYRWVLVQEHTVERAEDGGPLRQPHVPHRLVARNSRGEVASITALVKTQGSDAKLIGQMQPYYEAKGLSRIGLAGRSIPPLVTQISDGENGGVMMNEFPAKYLAVISECSGSSTPAVNGTEYLEYLQSIGIRQEDLPPIQPRMQKRIWDRFHDGDGPEAMEALIHKLKQEDHRFSMEGGSWTHNISWVRGYDHVLDAMEEASALFSQKVLQQNTPPSDPRYRNALYHLLLSQTSCYRYWGHGRWTDYGRELARRAMDILKYDF